MSIVSEGGLSAGPTPTPVDAVAAAPVRAEWREAARVEHVFTHFALTLTVLRAEAEEPADACWSRDLGALPSVFLKAARAGAGPLL